MVGLGLMGVPFLPGRGNAMLYQDQYGKEQHLFYEKHNPT
jgi:hypothetical protein